MILLLVIILVLFQIILQYQKKLAVFSTVNFFLFFYFVVLLLTSVYHYFNHSIGRIDLYKLETKHSKYYWVGFFIILKMLIFFSLGAIIYNVLSPGIKHDPKTQIINTDKINYKLLIIINSFILFVAVIAIFIHFDYGTQLFYRKEYLLDKKLFLKGSAMFLLVFSSIISGILFYRYKMLSIVSILIAVIIGLGVGSRFASVYVICFLVVSLIMIKNKKIKILYFLFSGIFIFAFMGLNLSFRSIGDGHHGLTPYFRGVLKHPDKIVDSIIFNVYYTFIFGYYVTVSTFKEYNIASLETLFISLNPLPGRIAGWYEIAPKLRFNIYAPYNAIGELARFPIFFMFYFFILGIIFSYIDKKINECLSKRKFILPIILFLLIVLFVIHSFEYNFRATNRFVVYSILVIIMFKVFSKIKPVKLQIKRR